MPEPIIHYGMCQAASDAFRATGIGQNIVQTIGNAPASAGVHAQDGILDGEPYCAAADISVLHPVALTDADIQSALSRLADHGFAGYYRKPGSLGWPICDEVHIHAVFAGIPMKRALRNQIHAWLHGLNGLAHEADYTYWQPSESQQQIVRALFLAHNPMNG